MLTQLHIENYKCLRDVTVDLGEFTILIGPNDSGKTSFLDVIQTLGEISRKPYQQVFFGDRSLDNLVWRKDANQRIVWDVSGLAANCRFAYRIELAPVGQQPPRESLEFDGRRLFWTEEVNAETAQSNAALPPGALVNVMAVNQGTQKTPARFGTTFLSQLVQQGKWPYPAIAETLHSSIQYRFDIAHLCQPAVPQAGESLHATGDNLAGVLDLLQNSPDRSAFEAIQKALHEEIPTIQGVVLPPSRQRPGAKALEFILSGDGRRPVSIPAQLASGGALLLTAYLALIHGEAPGVLLIEEPENGLHPGRLQFVVNILLRISKGQADHRKHQVIVTTHNPLLLNHANADEVRVFVPDREQGTTVTPMTKIPDIDRLRKEFATGELWYLLGEEKMFQGQPA